ncbi:MAG: hypothetical protein RJQ00_12635 [Vicingaceae bacterium]
MKKMILFKKLALNVLFLFATTANAQNILQVTESEQSISGLSGNALTIEINRAKQDKILNEWEELMEGYDGKVDTHDNMVHATEVKINDISLEKIEVAAASKKISATKNELSVIFYSGGKAISSTQTPAGFIAAERIVESFAKRISKEATETYREEQAKILDGLMDEFDNIKENQKDQAKEIEDAKEVIEEAKENKQEALENIEETKNKKAELSKAQEDLNEKIKAQEKVLEEAEQERKQLK